jgi:hypothetical protein
VSDSDTQQAPPPPPPPRSGSPFGRFLTSPVLLVGVLALAVGFAVFRSTGGGEPATDTRREPSGFAGSWETLPGDAAHDRFVRLELTDAGGTLAVDDCTGDLTPIEKSSNRWLLAYTDTSGERGCPQRLEVTVSKRGDETLRLEAQRGSRPYTAATLERR